MHLLVHHRVALAGATATSAIALSDAFTQGLTGHNTVFADTSGVRWAIVLGSLVHALTYAALVFVLLAEAPRIDTANRVARVLRRVLTACLVVLSVGFLVAEPLRAFSSPPAYVETAWTIVASATFAGVLLSALAIGPFLLRQPTMRIGAALLTGMAPLLGITILIGMLATAWMHPAYLETAMHFGIALLGTGSAGAVVAATSAGHEASAADTTSA